MKSLPSREQNPANQPLCGGYSDLSDKDLPGKEVISQDTRASWWKLVNDTYQEVRGRHPNFLELSALHYDESLVAGFIETFLEAGVSPNAKGVYHVVQNLLSRGNQVALRGIRALAQRTDSSNRLEFDSFVDMNVHKALVTQVLVELPDKVTIGSLNDKLLKAFSLSGTKLQPLATRLQLGPVQTLNFHVLHVLIFCYQLSLVCENPEDVAVKMYHAAQRSNGGVVGESKRLGLYDKSHVASMKDMYRDLIWKTLVPRLLMDLPKETVVARYNADSDQFEEKLSAILAQAVLLTKSEVGLVVRRPSLLMSLSERYHDAGFRITANGENFSDDGEWEAIHPTWIDNQTGITFEPVVSMDGLKAESEVHGHCIGLTGTFRNMCCKYQLQVYRLLKGSKALTTLGLRTDKGRITVYGNSGKGNRAATTDENQATARFIAKIKAGGLPAAYVAASNLAIKCATLSKGTAYQQMVAKMTADPLLSEEEGFFAPLLAIFFTDRFAPYRLRSSSAIDPHGNQRDTRHRLLTPASYEVVVQAARTWFNQKVPVRAK
jgi:hypothetical protein